MAMSGLQVYKLLPKTNCKDCGFPTCLAFAMKLAAKQVELDACPHVSDEAQEALSAASAPPIRLIKMGSGDREFQVGNETVMFRHEKTFFNQPGIALRVKDTEDADAVVARVEEAANYEAELFGPPGYGRRSIFTSEPTITWTEKPPSGYQVSPPEPITGPLTWRVRGRTVAGVPGAWSDQWAL